LADLIKHRDHHSLYQLLIIYLTNYYYITTSNYDFDHHQFYLSSFLFIYNYFFNFLFMFSQSTKALMLEKPSMWKMQQDNKSCEVPTTNNPISFSIANTWFIVLKSQCMQWYHMAVWHFDLFWYFTFRFINSIHNQITHLIWEKKTHM
jgi:hypothetical protein